MSSDAFEKFRGLVAGDPALREQCMKLVGENDVQQLLALARAQGCEFSAEEADEVLGDTELTDLELEVVAGGMIIPPSRNGIKKGTSLRD